MDVEAVSLMSSCHTHPMEDLSTSDYLSITVRYGMCPQDHCSGPRLNRVDWEKVWKGGLLEAFTIEVHTVLAPLLNSAYDDVKQLDREIEFVAGMLVDAADHLLPLVHPKRPTRWRDDILSSLCGQSRVARSAWKEAGNPLEGQL